MSQFWITLIAQIIGISGSVISIISYQFKKNKSYLLLQMSFGILIAIHFAMLKAWGGFMMNIIGMSRALIFAFKDRTNKKTNLSYGYVFCVLFLAGVIITLKSFEEVWFMGLVVCFAQTMGTVGFISDDPKKNRLIQLFFVAPFWLIYDIYYLSIGGMITESFVIISIVVSLFRFKFIGNHNNKTIK